MTYRHLIEALPAPNFFGYTPLSFQEEQIGYIDQQYISLLDEFPKIFQFVLGNRIGMFSQEFVEMSVSSRSHALADVSQFLNDSGVIYNWRDELFSIYADAERTEELFRIERGVLPIFGFQAHGVHLNGYTMINGEPYIWIAQRSKQRKVAPLKYDQMVAGGLPSDLSLMDNVCKEADEEARIPEQLVRQAVAVGNIQYITSTETSFGLRNDVLHCYDLELPNDFEPYNQDGEVEEFICLHVNDICKLLKQENVFKANTAWVMLHFLLRHNWLDVEEDERIYLMKKLSIN
ncbi:DUF4743 domain-containing protein [Wohlfahrtiimonas larvae]|uniref:DUF4743 domain-containing protein n=3 Tax=Wohlfahrtiimonas larvae TaxID=1157986 RepID=A0ABP9MA93_9GAMM